MGRLQGGEATALCEDCREELWEEDTPGGKGGGRARILQGGIVGGFCRAALWEDCREDLCEDYEEPPTCEEWVDYAGRSREERRGRCATAPTSTREE